MSKEKAVWVDNHDTIMAIEDHLQSHRVFRCGFDIERTAHSDSYATVVDFPSLDAAFAASEFSANNWRFACNYWLTNENMQPPLRLVALTLSRKLK